MAARIHWILLCVAISAAPLRSEQQSSSQAQQTPAVTAQDLIAVPNRPTFATTAESVQRGVFEIEYGLEAASGHQNINGLLKWGLLENLELRFANNPIQRNSGVTTTGDSGAGFKYKVFRQTKMLPTFSVVYTGGIPTAPHFDVNEGVQFVGRPGASGFDRNYFTSLSYAHPLPKKWGYTAELAGFSRTNATIPALMVVLGAITYSPSPRLVLDCGGYFAVYGNLPRFTFTAGLTYAVADLYHLRSRR